MSREKMEKLEREKIEARVKLQQLPPLEAQNIVNQTLYPQWWQMDLSSHAWEETIPINYGQTDT